MQWDVMDMTNMTYEAESMEAILDKGALDALMSDDSGNVHTNVHIYIYIYE